MLQQTQVDRVIPYYHAWLKRFPTVAELAAAPTADVITAWAGLGYNRRAVNLQRTARHVRDVLNGAFPHNVEGLLSLPGIGPYTAGAIACFAFEQPVAFIDTNMRRVLHRLFWGVDVPTPSAPDQDILTIAAAVLPEQDPWRWNQALIEFGALHCTARKPACVICPLQAECAAFPLIQSALAAIQKSPRPKTDGPFEGSNRFYRGRVINALRDHPRDGFDLISLGAVVRPGFTDDDVPWLYDLVQGLSRDGLARIAEERPPYLVDEADSNTAAPAPPSVRVTLP